MKIDKNKVIVTESKFAKLKNKLVQKHYNSYTEASARSRYNEPGSSGINMIRTEIKADAACDALVELLGLLDECVTDSGKEVE